jgi:hypothetical protein
MERKNSNRTRKISLRLTPEEYAAIEQRMKASTCRKLSDYVRRNLFDKPVVTTYRNRSQDDTLIELTRLRNELNAVGNNFNQAVKRLHALRQIPEFRTWLITWELEKKILFNKMDEVKNNVKKILEVWSQ